MKEIIQLFQKREQMDTLEKKVLGREELLYLIQSKNSSDLLLKEIVSILELLLSVKENTNLESNLAENFNLFSKYGKESQEKLKKNLFTLIDLSEKYLSDKHKVSTLGEDFYCSKVLSAGAKETYYLMVKLQKEIEFPLSIGGLVKKAKGVLTKEEKLKLEEDLRIFKMNKDK